MKIKNIRKDVKMNLYLLTNKLDDWYVLSNDSTSAENILMDALNKADYGFSKNRIITNIKILAREINLELNQGFSFNGGNNLLIDRN